MICQFSLVTAKQSTFIESIERFSGTIVFNARGGCFFIKNGLKANAKLQIFRKEQNRVLAELKFSEGEKVLCTFKQVEIKLLGEKSKGPDCGLIVKFVNLDEAHLEKLNTLVDKLPKVESDSELLDDGDDCDNKAA